MPASYVALSPFCRVLDALTLFTVRQHLLLMASALLATLVIGARSARASSRLGATLGALRLGVVCVTVLVAVYAIGTLVPRPMAALRLADPALVAVDFHSHTDQSWDGRRGFDAERNRRWHALAGFDVAYVTDHKSFEGARRGAARNPDIAGRGVVLLSGLETIVDGEHLCVLGVTAADGPLDREGRLAHAAIADRRSGGAPVVSVLTIPATLSSAPGGLTRDATLAALEISDAAPKGLEFSDARRTELLRIADSLDLGLVSGSDNHGWGRTAAAWSVMRIPGWRAMSPARLDARIREELRARGSDAVRVVVRTAPADARWSADLFAAPRVVVGAALSLTRAERVAWLAWLLGALAVRAALRRAARAMPEMRRTDPSARTAREPA